MVFGDEVAYGFGKLGAFGPFESVGDVARDYACALFGFEGVVWVDTMLVFSEEGGIVDLAYVVIQCAGPDKLYVGAYLKGCFGGEVAHGHGVLEGARALF